MELIKIIIIGIITCFVSLLIKQIKPEFYIVVILTGSIVMLFMIIDQLSIVFDYFLTIFNKTNLSYSIFSSILKVVGVGYLTEFASGICYDTGTSSIGDKIVFAGKVLIICLSLPIITELLNIIVEILP